MSHYHGCNREDGEKEAGIHSWSAGISRTPGAFAIPPPPSPSVAGSRAGGVRERYPASRAGPRIEVGDPSVDLGSVRAPPSRYAPSVVESVSTYRTSGSKRSHRHHDSKSRSRGTVRASSSRYAPSVVESVSTHRSSRTSRSRRGDPRTMAAYVDESKSRRGGDDDTASIASGLSGMTISAEQPTSSYSSVSRFQGPDGPREILTDSRTYGRARDRVTMTSKINRPASSTHGRSSYADQTAAARNPYLAAPSTYSDSRSRRGGDEGDSVISSSPPP